ncbi:hypothetical protein D3C84_772920 [compost metagenome]
MRQQGFGAAWNCQGGRDVSGGTADGQIPDLSAQRSTLLLQHAVQLSFAAVVFFSPGSLEFFDVAGLASGFLAIEAGLLFSILARLISGLLLVQKLLDFGFQAGYVFWLRQAFNTEDKLAFFLGVERFNGVIETVQSVQLIFQTHLLVSQRRFAGPARRYEKAPSLTRPV